MRFISVVIQLLLIIGVQCRGDPYSLAQELLQSLPDKSNPMVSSSLEVDPFLDSVSEGIRITIPMDYYEEQQKRDYTRFWSSKASDGQKKAYELLVESATTFNNSEAVYMLSRLNLLGDYLYPNNKTLAFEYLVKFNQLTDYSNSTALFDLAVMHSTGLFGTIPIDHSKALIYYTKAAELGDLRAKQALAYRYFTGLNVPRDCSKALLLYSEIARELREQYSDEEWNIILPHFESYNVRISDFNGGLLGKGLSSTRLSTVRKRSARPDITSSFLTNLSGGRIILQYSRNGGAFAHDDEEDDDDKLIDIYYTALDNYEGTYTQSRNYTMALRLLNFTYMEYDTKVKYMGTLQRYFYGKCLQLLGHMYFRGDGLPHADIPKAELYLKRAIKVAEVSQNSRSRANTDLGLIYQYVHGNITEAIRYYKRVIDSSEDDGTAEFQLAMMAIERKSPVEQYTLIQKAAFKGYEPAIFGYAHMNEMSVRDRFSCEDTAQLYKSFAEINEIIIAPSLKMAFMELLCGNTEVALWYYSQAAEQGYEVAQTSAAYLLYQPPRNLEEAPIIPDARRNMALTFYTRAYKQANPDAGVIAGDIYFRAKDYSRAVAMYQGAALKFCVQGMWNLGYMYEYGLGVEQDFHLAKRYYEQVIERNRKLYFGVRLTILKLKLKSWLIWVTGGKVNYSTREDASVEENHKTSHFQSLMKVFKKVGRENSRGVDSAAAQKQGSMQQQQQQHQQQQPQQGILERLESWGVHIEDLITIGFVLVFFIVSFLLRTLAIRRGWNVRINGVPVQQQQNNNNNGNNNNGAIDIQFFAI